MGIIKRIRDWFGDRERAGAIVGLCASIAFSLTVFVYFAVKCFRIFFR